MASDERSLGRVVWDLAESLNSLGTMLHQSHNGAEAEAAYRRALAVYEDLTDRHGTEPKYRLGLAFGLNNLGTLLHDRGAHAGAEEAFRRAVALGEQLTADSAAVPEYRLGLAISLSHFGNLLRLLTRA